MVELVERAVGEVPEELGQWFAVVLVVSRKSNLSCLHQDLENHSDRSWSDD